MTGIPVINELDQTE